ncbi:hypothetical protein [Arundinibacter roseus]|uniref:Uncharacterized protein n=1 Tax=Arundinibacter roseus TaxID=2070510 RepID=A0A4R4KFW3_9BACT|nr:hypothetical protein [Arundinibacter roseus]TDB66828.1 hypothetical protein EZE20_06800 [Arundinibacter roseus]
MKKVMNVLVALAVFAVAVVLPNEVLAHVLGDPAASGLVLGAVLNFATLDATSHQTGNPGGTRQLLVALAKSITGVWPKRSDITGGEITSVPTLDPEATKWARYECPDGTIEVSSEKQGDPGFQSYKHAIEFMFSGFSKAIQAELEKYMNAGAVFIVEMNDGTYAVVGSSDNAIFVKQAFKGGKKGNDKRGFTMKGEQDGFVWDILPLATAQVAELEIATEGV